MQDPKEEKTSEKPQTQLGRDLGKELETFYDYVEHQNKFLDFLREIGLDKEKIEEIKADMGQKNTIALSAIFA